MSVTAEYLNPDQMRETFEQNARQFESEAIQQEAHVEAMDSLPERNDAEEAELRARRRALEVALARRDAFGKRLKALPARVPDETT